MKCGKSVYIDRKAAKKAMKDHNKQYGRSFKLMDVYFCEDCMMWHTTSIPKANCRYLKQGNGPK